MSTFGMFFCGCDAYHLLPFLLNRYGGITHPLKDKTFNHIYWKTGVRVFVFCPVNGVETKSDLIDDIVNLILFCVT